MVKPPPLLLQRYKANSTVYTVTADVSKVKPLRAKGWAEMKQNANEGLNLLCH